MAFGTAAQDPEFAATPPAKVLLDLDGVGTPGPAETAEPAPEPEVAPEQDSTPDPVTAPEIASQAVPAAGTAVDELISETGAYMAEQEAADSAPATEAAENPAPDAVASPMKTVGRGVVALCLTLVLLLLLFAAVKRWGQKTPLLAGQQLARVIGRVGLSPQASLHFVQTNGEVLVIGVTQQNVSLLRTFDASDFETPTEVAALKAPNSVADPATNFLTQLKESRATLGVEAVVDEDLDQLKGELQRLKQYFQDSTRGRD
jgi:flagellar biogenesis protein FliO